MVIFNRTIKHIFIFSRTTVNSLHPLSNESFYKKVYILCVFQTGASERRPLNSCGRSIDGQGEGAARSGTADAEEWGKDQP